MAVSLSQLGVELRIIADPSDTLEDAQSQVIENILNFAQGVVDERAPNAPAWAKDEAVIRLSAYRYDMPSAPIGGGYSDFFTNSGAASLLSDWITRRAVTLEQSEGDALDTRSGGGITEADVRAYVREELGKLDVSGTDADSIARAAAATAQSAASDAQDTADTAEAEAESGSGYGG